MKKIIFSALAVLVGAFVFVSCSKEAKLEKDIVGTWELTRYYDSEEGEWYNYTLTDGTYIYVFKSNNKGSYTWKSNEYGERETYSFSYTITDDKLTMIDEYGDRESYTISIKGKKMVWEYEGDKMELTKQ